MFQRPTGNKLYEDEVRLTKRVGRQYLYVL